MKINKIIIILLLLNFPIPLFGQIIKISDKLTAVKITDGVYIHSYENCNGLIVVNNKKAIIVSTPPSDEATLRLINWTKEKFSAKIIGYVIDRWHPDAMEGLDVVEKLGIKSYSSELTRIIAKQKGLPIPDTGFNYKLELKAGNEKLICQYFGPAHTTDGIVVWMPKEKILFGGNEIRNYNGWVGNIADADLTEWSNTIEKVKKEFGSARIVIPGHGNYGGPELLDYTIKLYKPNKWGKILRDNNIIRTQIFNDCGDIFETAVKDSTNGNVRILKDAVVLINNNKRYIKVESPLIEHDIENKSIKSEYGRLRVYNKSAGIDNPATDLYYSGLNINLRNDAVGIEIIVREMIR